MAGMNGAMAPDIQTVFLPASPERAPDHRHTRAADRGHGRRHLAFRAGARCGPPEEEIREIIVPFEFARSSHDPHSRRRGCARLRIPALAQAVKLPAGADPQNTLVIDTTKGRIVIKLRTDLAPEARRAAEDAGARRLLQQRAVPSRDGRLHGADRRRTEIRRHRQLEISESRRRVHPDTVQARRGRHGARAPIRIRRIRNSSSASPTPRSSTANTPLSAKWCPAWTSSTSSRRRRPVRKAAPSPIPTRW